MQHQKVCAALCIFLFTLGCRGEDVKNHILTWGGHLKGGVQVTFDDKERGFGAKGFEAVKLEEVKKGDTVVVHFPKGSDIFDTHFSSPYSSTGLINAWIKKGVKIIWRLDDQDIEVHTLAWENYDWNEEHLKIDNVQFLWDGKDIGGKGAAAIEKLKAIEIPKRSFVQLVFPQVITPSGTEVGCTPLDKSGVLEMWKEKNIRVENLLEYGMPKRPLKSGAAVRYKEN